MKRNTRRKGFIKRNIILISLILTLFIYVSVTLIKQQLKLKELKEQEAIILARIEELKSQKAELEKKIEESNDLEFIEKVAREKLKMVKPNEIIYIIQDEEKEDEDEEEKLEE